MCEIVRGGEIEGVFDYAGVRRAKSTKLVPRQPIDFGAHCGGGCAHGGGEKACGELAERGLLLLS